MLLVPLDMSPPRQDARAQMRNIISAQMSHELTFPVQAEALGIIISPSMRHLPTSGTPQGLRKVHSLLLGFFPLSSAAVYLVSQKSKEDPHPRVLLTVGQRISDPAPESCCLRGGDMLLIRPSLGAENWITPCKLDHSMQIKRNIFAFH